MNSEQKPFVNFEKGPFIKCLIRSILYYDKSNKINCSSVWPVVPQVSQGSMQHSRARYLPIC